LELGLNFGKSYKILGKSGPPAVLLQPGMKLLGRSSLTEKITWMYRVSDY